MKLKSALAAALLASLGSAAAGPAIRVSIGCPPAPVWCPPRPVVYCAPVVIPAGFVTYGTPQVWGPQVFTNQRIVGAAPVVYQVPAPVFAPAVQVPATPFGWRR